MSNVVPLSTRIAACEGAGDKHVYKYLTSLLTSESARVQKTWVKVLRMKYVHDLWLEVDALHPGQQERMTLYEAVLGTKEAVNLNNIVTSFYFDLSAQHVTDARATERTTPTFTTNPSATALATLRWHVRSSVNKNSANYLSYRVLYRLTHGNHADVYAMALRTTQLDTAILKQIRECKGQVSWNIQDLLRGKLGELKPSVILKRAEKTREEEASLAREYLLMTNVNAVTLQHGVRLCPVPYCLSYTGTNHIIGVTRGQLSHMVVDSGDPFIEPDRRVLFMQYVHGRVIESCSLSFEEVGAILAYLHGFLGWLWKKDGVVHNDIHQGNLILEGYGEGRTYTLPIVDEDGDVLCKIALPYRPVLVDWSMGSSAEVNGYGVNTSPLRSTLCDVISMYTRLHPYAANTSAYNNCKTLAGLYMSESNEQANPKLFFPPYGLDITGLTHSEMQRLLISGGTLLPFLTTEQGSPEEPIELTPPDTTGYAELRQEAIALQQAGITSTYPLKKSMTRYLKQTAEYYL